MAKAIRRKRFLVSPKAHTISLGHRANRSKPILSITNNLFSSSTVSANPVFTVPFGSIKKLTFSIDKCEIVGDDSGWPVVLDNDGVDTVDVKIHNARLTMRGANTVSYNIAQWIVDALPPDIRDALLAAADGGDSGVMTAKAIIADLVKPMHRKKRN